MKQEQQLAEQTPELEQQVYLIENETGSEKLLTFKQIKEKLALVTIADMDPKLPMGVLILASAEYQTILQLQRIDKEVNAMMVEAIGAVLIAILILVAEDNNLFLIPLAAGLIEACIAGRLVFLNLNKRYLSKYYSKDVVEKRLRDIWSSGLNPRKAELEEQIEAAARALGFHQYDKYSVRHLSNLVNQTTQKVQRVYNDIRQKAQEKEEEYQKQDVARAREERIKRLAERMQNADQARRQEQIGEYEEAIKRLRDGE